MFRPFDLISKEYVGEQRILHARPNGYGGKGEKWADAVASTVVLYDAFSVLDYGCGQGRLVAALKLREGLNHLRFAEYDPAIPGKDETPSFADLVVCTDVLEHIEPDRLDTVLKHLTMLARKAIFLVVATRVSNKELSDGRNAHLTVQPADWWYLRIALATGWQISESSATSDREFVAVVAP